ncbi:MAG: phosphoribosylformylglycinamidine synthase subunit PurS, partial [Geobacteraceae bacterium]
MVRRIEIALKEDARDARGERIKREIAHSLKLPVADVRTIDVYTIDAALSDREVEK